MTRVCEICGKVFVPVATQTTCSYECKTEKSKRWRKEYYKKNRERIRQYQTEANKKRYDNTYAKRPRKSKYVSRYERYEELDRIDKLSMIQSVLGVHYGRLSYLEQFCPKARTAICQA